MKAIFPGKFHPPHIGHIKTILRLQKEYDLLVCITTDTPDNPIMTPEQIAGELAEINKVMVFNGTLTKQKTNPFPEYTILSGNPDVIKWAKKLKAKHKFIPRTGNVSGTQLRNGKNS